MPRRPQSRTGDPDDDVPPSLTRAVHELAGPRCVRCRQPQPGAPALWVLCPACREADDQRARAHQAAIEAGKVPKRRYWMLVRDEATGVATHRFVEEYAEGGRVEKDVTPRPKAIGEGSDRTAG
jgi:hypothetical protein